MDSECLENYVWIYAHASDIDQGVLWGIPFQLWQLKTVVTIKNSFNCNSCHTCNPATLEAEFRRYQLGQQSFDRWVECVTTCSPVPGEEPE